MRFKRGYVREDGMVFLHYYKGKERWVEKDELEKIKKQRRDYVAASKKARSSMRKTKRTVGDKHPTEYLFFLGYNSLGSERWGSLEKLKHEKEQADLRQIKYRKGLKNIVKPTAKIGDKHPTKKDLFVIIITKKGVLKYGTQNELNEVLETHQLNRTIRNMDIIENRRVLMARITKKLHRGDKNSDGRIFYKYDNFARPVWLTQEEFEKKMAKNKEIKRKQKKGN
jgi:hypothetical protein